MDDHRAAWTSDEPVIAVDGGDVVVGSVSRTEAHGEQSVLHRAFSTLLYDREGRVLICRRSAIKRLWPLVWADSCAGHPLPGEDTKAAAERRVFEELRCRANLTPVGTFRYRAAWGDAGYEDELCHGFIGPVCVVDPDPLEIAEVELLTLPDLRARFAEDPDAYAPWLKGLVELLPDTITRLD